MKRTTKIISIAIALLMLLSQGVLGAMVNKEFRFEIVDISEGDWYYDGVVEGYKKRITKGAQLDHFFPNKTVTREAFVTMLMRIGEGRLIPSNGTPFTDVPYERWSSGAVSTALERGIVQGMSSTYFGACLPITREAMATMLARYLDSRSFTLAESSTPEAEFTDAEQVSDWAVDAVELMRKTGLMKGYEDGSFHPRDTATRAEAVVLLVRLMDEIGFKNIFELESTDVSRIVIKTNPVYTPGDHCCDGTYHYTTNEITDADEIVQIVESIASLESRESYLPEYEILVGGSVAFDNISFYNTDGERILCLFFEISDNSCYLEGYNIQRYVFDAGSLNFLKDYMK